MAFTCKNKIWLENPADLFCSFSVIPLTDMSLEAQLNAITRLVILVFLVLLLLNFRYSLLFLLLSLLFIIILYYIQRSQMERFNTERYSAPHVAQYAAQTRNRGMAINNKGQMIIDRPSTYRFCDNDVLLQYNKPGMSINQKLAGPPNAKTMVAPVVVAPSAALDYWKTNNLVNHSHVNRESQQEAYQSGFQVTTCCGDTSNDYMVPQQHGGRPQMVPVGGENFHSLSGRFAQPPPAPEPQETKEDYEYPYMKTPEGIDNSGPIRPKRPGEINTACGYNPRQLQQAGLPTNYPAGNCEKDPVYKQYNENLWTQTIEPGVYTRNEVNEPINANIGISFTQQFEPTTCHVGGDGGLMYTEHDPRIIEPVAPDPNMAVIEPVTEYNVYDPRHSGYGTSYRSYSDQQLGQTRFMYDDVDAIRMPNYITRNNIDFQPYADHYGPLPAGGAHGNEFNSKIRALANDSFTRATIQQRTDIEERALRKRNAEMWQLRQAPIRTGGQFMAGSMSCRA